MKDFFVGIAIGAVAGAMIANNPKAQQAMEGIKNKVKSGSCGCGCGGGQNGENAQGGEQQQSGGQDNWQ